MAERKFDDFDEYADDYRSIHSKNIKLSGTDSFYFSKMKVDQISRFEQDGRLTFVDIGCGDGATETYVAKKFPGWTMIGVDISETSISVAKNKQIPSATFLKYDGVKIPLRAASADVVFIAGVLHHIEFRFHIDIIQEALRILKVGGRMYVFEHNPNNPLTKYLVKTCVFDKDAKLLSAPYTLKMLKSAGLEISKTDFIIFFPRNILFKPLLFIEKYLRWLPLGGQYFISGRKPV